MPQESVQLPLRTGDGHVLGALLIANLPGRQDTALSAHGDTALREGGIYRYEISSDATNVEVEPRELFDPDDASWKQGRLRAGQAVGRLRIRVVDRATELSATAEVDVLALKLDHESEYRQMLADISAFAAEAVLQGFAPSTVDLAPSDLPADLLYLRFAIISAYLQDPAFEAAIARVLSQPHRSWISEQEIRPIGSPFPAGAAFRRAVCAPGPRVPWAGGPVALASLPAALTRDRAEASVDNSANQFVKFALERWRVVTLEVLEVLTQAAQNVESGPIRRGLQIAADVGAQLDEYLAHPIFREVSALRRMPTSDQVLLKRAGYREVFRTFAMTESGPTVRIDRGDMNDIFAASQRNIATLYEFWCFLAVVDSLGRVCGEDRTARAFNVAGDGMSLTMRSGRASKLSWTVKRAGRLLEVDAFFNRTFAGRDDRRGSWSRAMRPDCSVRIRPEGNTPSLVSAHELEVWLHFDAKYRVDNLLAQLTSPPDLDESSEGSTTSVGAKRDDLLKMHAYRDAITRTAGAYVLYPGSEVLNLRRHPGFKELLPGLGAFPLRPSSDGLPLSSQALDQFFRDVVDHVASQVTRDERHRFWTATVHRPGEPALASALTTDFLDEPPADTDVLLGFVRSSAQREWIERLRQYNIRADDRVGAVEIGGRELGAKLLLLYEDRSDVLRVAGVAQVVRWRPATAANLLATGYPNPRGVLYFVADFEFVEDLPTWIYSIDLELLTANARDAAPLVVTWWDVVRAASGVEI
ncbi:restriction endonuclease-like protein [Mycobacteriaceae bacterium Msp059]|nr:restriction endonuclease-like protein [Mycobacteriaceae bacterium Msp059]